MDAKVTRRSFITGSVAAGTAALAAGSAVALADEGVAALPDTLGKHTWEVAPDPIEDIDETYDFDVVVVGGGLAGSSAMEAAARSGAKVALLERNGYGRFCGYDLAAPGSQALERAGIEVDIDEAVRLLFAYSNQTANYQLIRNWAEQAGRVVDYIESICSPNGVQVVAHAGGGTSKDGWDQLPERYRVLTDAIGFVSDDGATAAEPHEFLGKVLVKVAQDNGAQIFYDTRGEQLVGDAQTGITGVVATTDDGRHLQFNASQGVVLATGDIGGNPEMIDAFAPICNRADASSYVPVGANTGDGILMGCWAGAALSRTHAAPMCHTFTLTTNPPARSFQLSAFNMTWLAVNTEGVRYASEMPFEPYVTNARMNTAGNKAWSIFDSNYAEYIEKQYPGQAESWLEGTALTDSMAAFEELGMLVQADTVAELADRLGIPADALEASVEDWNAMADAGEDKRFQLPEKYLSHIAEPPFYAFPVLSSTLAVCFGLHVNANSQVLTDDDQPIAGLFAVGNVQGDFFNETYPVHCPGVSTSRCLVYGQLVGEALAKGTVLSEII